MFRTALSSAIGSIVFSGLCVAAIGCQTATENAELTNLAGQPLHLQVVSTTVERDAVRESVFVNGKMLEVEAADGRVSVREHGASHVFQLELKGDQVLSVSEGFGSESHQSTWTATDSASPYGVLVEEGVELVAAGELSEGDAERLNVVLPVALYTTHRWVETLTGGEVATDADNLVRVYASSLFNAPQLDDPGSAPQDIIRNLGTSCSVQGTSCSCSVTCTSTQTAACTNYPTCSCSCVNKKIIQE